MATSLTDFARFILWANTLPSCPTAKEIVTRFDVGMMTAYRWREHFTGAKKAA